MTRDPAIINPVAFVFLAMGLNLCRDNTTTKNTDQSCYVIFFYSRTNGRKSIEKESTKFLFVLLPRNGTSKWIRGSPLLVLLIKSFIWIQLRKRNLECFVWRLLKIYFDQVEIGLKFNGFMQFATKMSLEKILLSRIRLELSSGFYNCQLNINFYIF